MRSHLRRDFTMSISDYHKTSPRNFSIPGAVELIVAGEAFPKVAVAT